MIENYMFKMYLGDNIADDSSTRETIQGQKFYTKLNTEKSAWKEIAQKAVELGFKSVLIELADGVKYKSHPEIAVEGAWEVVELKEELQYLRDIGLTPLPKLNFSTAHDAWLGVYSRMVSTKEYYEAVRELIFEVVDIFDKPEMMHIGLEDEGKHAQVRYDYVCYRQYALYWHDYKFLLDTVRECGVRPWVSVDPYIVNKEKFLENTDKDVVVSPLYEGNFFTNGIAVAPDVSTEKGKRLRAFTELPELGYDIIPTSSPLTTIDLPPRPLIQYVYEMTDLKKVKSILFAPHCKTTETKKYILMERLSVANRARKTVEELQN